MEREVLTPGRLYQKLSAEFRRMRPAHCGHCRMPMVVLTYRPAPEDCNWAVEELGPLCDKCRPLIAAIVKEAAEQYDIADPVSTPFFPIPALRQMPNVRSRH